MGKQIAVFALPEDFIDLVGYLKSKFSDLIRLDQQGKTVPLTSDYSHMFNLIHQSTLETFRHDFPEYKQWKNSYVSLELDGGLFLKNGQYHISDMAAGRLYIQSGFYDWPDYPDGIARYIPMYQETVELYYEACRYFRKRSIRYYSVSRSGKSRSYVYALPNAHEAIQTALREIPDEIPRWFTDFTCEIK